MTRQTGTSERGKAASQRDRLAGLLHDVRCQCGRPVETDFTRANALLARGVRIVDVDTLARAFFRTPMIEALVQSDRDMAESLLAALDAEP